MIHYPTCMVWYAGQPSDCDCAGQKPWRIKKTDDQEYPWLVSRRTGDEYEEFMPCRTFEKARQLTMSMIWLSGNGLRSPRRKNHWSW